VLTLLVLGAFAFATIVVVAALTAFLGFIGFVITLPFRILGWALKLAGLLIALPFILLFGLLGFGFALAPVLPLVGLGWLAWWLFRERKPDGSHARVVS
jgi:hypothetical protein